MNFRATVTFAISLAAGLELGAASMPRINLDDPPATTPPPASAKPKTATPAKAADAPAAKTPAPKKDSKKKKDEPPPKIEGMEIQRGDRGYLGIKIEDNTFKVRFYDKEKKPMKADAARIALRWNVNYQPNPERTLLEPGDDGKVMSSEKTVRPPHAFKLFITLLNNDAPGEDPAAESYVVDFRQ